MSGVRRETDCSLWFVLWAITLLVVGTLVAIARAFPGDPRWTIVPGQGLLPEKDTGAESSVLLGAREAVVEVGLAAIQCPRSWFETRYEAGVLVTLKIMCGGPIRTARGVGIGTFADYVRREFGEPSRVYGDPVRIAQFWVYEGIAFRIIMDQRGHAGVQAIYVFLGRMP